MLARPPIVVFWEGLGAIKCNGRACPIAGQCGRDARHTTLEKEQASSMTCGATSDACATC
eukprot:1157977-Pelagomonas_calceolata.AAC.10